MSIAIGNRRPAAVAYTVSVILASALAKEDMQWLRRYAERRYEFRLLAAAGRPTPEIPSQGWQDLRGLLKIEVEPRADGLQVSVQAQGYAALVRLAGHSARLCSSDGSVDVRIGFDASGRALAVLIDSPAVHAALGHLYITLDAPASEAADPATQYFDDDPI